MPWTAFPKSNPYALDWTLRKTECRKPPYKPDRIDISRVSLLNEPTSKILRPFVIDDENIYAGKQGKPMPEN
jgi:hypothetical protein